MPLQQQRRGWLAPACPHLRSVSYIALVERAPRRMTARRIALGAVHAQCAPARARQRRCGRSVHDTDEVVDVVLAVAVLPALDVVQPLLVHAAARRAQLERPQEVGRLRSTSVPSAPGSVTQCRHAAGMPQQASS